MSRKPRPSTSLVTPPEPRPQQAELITPGALEVFREVAQRFHGFAGQQFLWFGPAQMRGVHEGRALRLTCWRERIHVDLPAPVGVDLRVEEAPVWRRWLFGETLRTSGGSRHLVDPALDLLRRFGVTYLEVAGGRLRAVGTPGLSAARIVSLVLALHDLVWGGGAPTPTSAPEPQPAGKDPVAGTRCPFCHDDLTPDAPVVHCATCDAPHHPSCFEEGGGCSIAGCQQSRARGRKSS